MKSITLFIQQFTPPVMKYLLSCMLLVICCSQSVFAAFEPRLSDARIRGLGGASAALAGYTPSIFSNPATIASTGPSDAGVSWYDPFMETDISTLQAYAALRQMPFDAHGTAGIGYERFGNRRYRETMAVVGYATKVFSGLTGGVSVSYMQREIAAGENDSAVGLNAGIVLAVSSKIDIGAAVQSVNEPGIGDHDERVTSTTIAGIALRPSENVVLAGDVEFRKERDAAWRLGGEAAVLPCLVLRAGVSGNPSTFSAGAGYRHALFRADAAIVRHPDFNDPGFAIGIQAVL